MNRPPSDASAGPSGPWPRSDAQSGREEVEVVWTTHRRWLAAVLLAHMPHEADLEDLLQEVALIVMKKLDQLEDWTRLRPWLRSIAINAARGSARTLNARIETHAEDEFDPADNASVREDATRSVRAELAHVLRIVRRLTPEHREPLLLKSVEGMNQREIADALEISEEAVESRLARARRKLREAMFKRSDSSTFTPPQSS